MNLLPRLTPDQLHQLFAETLNELEAEAGKQPANVERVADLASRLNMLQFLMHSESGSPEERIPPEP